MYVTVAAWLLVACLVGAAVASAGAALVAYERYRAKQRAAAEAVADEAPPAEEKPHNYRHNIHCPRCGRFARADADLPGLISCKYHGLVFRVPSEHPITGEIQIVQIPALAHARLEPPRLC